MIIWVNTDNNKTFITTTNQQKEKVLNSIGIKNIQFVNIKTDFRNDEEIKFIYYTPIDKMS